MIKKCFLLCVIFLGVFVASSCSSKDDESGVSSFTINGEKYRAETGECCNAEHGEIYGDGYVSIDADFAVFLQGSSFYNFDLRFTEIAEIRNLKAGDDITDLAYVRHLNLISDPGGNMDYEEVGGTIIVKKITSKAIILEFTNFKFNKMFRDSVIETYVMNGVIEYEIILNAFGK